MDDSYPTIRIVNYVCESDEGESESEEVDVNDVDYFDLSLDKDLEEDVVPSERSERNFETERNCQSDTDFDSMDQNEPEQNDQNCQSDTDFNLDQSQTEQNCQSDTDFDSMDQNEPEQNDQNCQSDTDFNLDQSQTDDETDQNVQSDSDFNLDQSETEIDDQTEQNYEIKRGGKYAMAFSDLPSTFQKLFREVHSFWTKPTNLIRRSTPISSTTFDKNQERVLCYLGFLRDHLPTCFTTEEAFSSPEPLEEYLDFLREARQLNPSTLSLHVGAILYFVKYFNREHAPLYKNVPLIDILRSCGTALQKEGDTLRLTTKEDLQAAEKWLDWDQVLGALKTQQTKFDLALGLKKAKEMANLVLISLYCRIPPSRGLEIRTLRVVCETDTPKPSTNWKKDYQNKNIIYLLEDGTIQLHLQVHKTQKSFGADHLNLEADSELTHVIRDYVKTYRGQLVGEQSENFLLLNSNGGPFCSATLTSRLKSVFYDLTGARVSINSLRTSFVTYCYDQKHCTDHLKDSIAASMRHSRKQAEKTYDRRTKCQKKRSAMAFAEELADTATEQATTDPTPSTSGESRPKKFKAGDFVAILEQGSSITKPLVQIGRIQYYVRSDQVELLWYKKRAHNTYSLELDSNEWIEYEGDLLKVVMAPKKGKTSSNQWTLKTTERTVHKELTDG